MLEETFQDSDLLFWISGCLDDSIFLCCIGSSLARQPARAKHKMHFISGALFVRKMIFFFLPDQREIQRREERSLESAIKKFKVKPFIVYLHSDVESKYPLIRAPEFLENLEQMFSVSKRSKRP